MKYALCCSVFVLVIELSNMNLTSTFDYTQLFLKLKTQLRIIYEKMGARRDILKGGEPSPGFEQYWPNMEHFYGNTTERNVGTATVNFTMTTPRQVCGSMPCPYAYMEYGYVCGKALDKDNLTYSYNTFDDLCAMEMANCNNPSKWSVAYKGKCGVDYHPWIENGKQIVSNKVKHAYEFFSRLPAPEPPATTKRPSNIYFNGDDYKSN